MNNGNWISLDIFSGLRLLVEQTSKLADLMHTIVHYYMHWTSFNGLWIRYIFRLAYSKNNNCIVTRKPQVNTERNWKSWGMPHHREQREMTTKRVPYWYCVTHFYRKFPWDSIPELHTQIRNVPFFTRHALKLSPKQMRSKTIPPARRYIDQENLQGPSMEQKDKTVSFYLWPAVAALYIYQS